MNTFFKSLFGEMIDWIFDWSNSPVNTKVNDEAEICDGCQNEALNADPSKELESDN